MTSRRNGGNLTGNFTLSQTDLSIQSVSVGVAHHRRLRVWLDDSQVLTMLVGRKDELNISCCMLTPYQPQLVPFDIYFVLAFSIYIVYVSTLLVEHVSRANICNLSLSFQKYRSPGVVNSTVRISVWYHSYTRSLPLHM